MTVEIKGQAELINFIKKQSEPEKLYDPLMKKVTAQNLRNIKSRNLKDTGNTARAWKVKKNGLSNYSITNDVKTEDKKHLITWILNKGRKEIVPKKPGGVLYIPISEAGKAKKLGASTEGLEFGVDFVYAKKAKAFKGTKYLDKFEIDSLKYVVRSLMAEVVKQLRK